MAEIKKLVPKRRFKEFQNAGEWEERKLTDEVELFSGLTYSPNNIVKENGTLVLRSSNVKNGEVVNADNVYVNSEVVNTCNVKNRDIIVVVRNGSRSLIGKHAQIKGDMDKTVIGAFMTGLRSYHSNFINALLDTPVFKSEIDKNLGATINQITNGMFHQMDFLMPYNKEKDKIGIFFQNLDSQITLQQRKLEKIKAMKKAYLSEMFPAAGQTKPKRRFKGFTEDWVEKKLGEIVDSFEYGLNAAAKEFDGKNKYIRITDIDEDTRLYLKTSICSPNIDLSHADNFKLKYGDILFARTGASVGKSYIYRDTDGLVYYAGFLIRARINKIYNPEFIFYSTLTVNYKEYIRITSQRSGQPGVNAQEYSQYIIKTPKPKEQQKIGNFFSDLDKQITLHQKKLSKLQNLKKSYLNEMFI